ncbi:unnamed protein product [Urochloa humidicola]
MAVLTSASSAAAAGTTAHDPVVTTPSAQAAVCLVPFRWWARLLQQNDDAAAGGVHFAATAAASPCWYGLSLLHSFVHPDFVLRLERGECRPGGTSYALVPADELSRAHARHNSELAYAGDGEVDCTYPLVLRVSVQQTCNLIVKITRKDNAVEICKRAAEMFSTYFQPIHVWDFSDLTDIVLMNRPHLDCCRTKQEARLEVQVYEISDISIVYKTVSGSADSPNVTFPRAGSMGLTGLKNLGNTCFMNSSIQCLVHTPKLAGYFLQDIARDLQQTNAPRPNGGLALAFGDLLRTLWTSDKEPVSAVLFKEKVSCFAPQFRGSNQHDSQDFLTSLLDGLHEDLNQVKCKKPCQVVKDAGGRPDEEVAEEYWSNYLAQNKSVIADNFHGLYKSTLTCATCNKKSVTFDPFVCLSLPVTSTPKRAMTVTVFSTDGSSEPFSCDVSVPKYGHLSDLLHALSIASSLEDDEVLLVTEVYNNGIIRYLEEPSFPLLLLMDVAKLAAYRLRKENLKSSLVVFSHQYFEENSSVDTITPKIKKFGVPLLAALPDTVNGLSLSSILIKLLVPFRSSKRASSLNDCAGSSDDFVDMMDTTLSDSDSSSQNEPIQTNAFDFMDISDSDSDYHNSLESGNHNVSEEFELYLENGRGGGQVQKIEVDELDLLKTSNRLHVIVHWHRDVLRQYNTSMLNNLPENNKLELISKGTEDAALHGCLEAFLKEELLEPEDMWYCPLCGGNRQTMKKLDLWRLPEVIVIHLNRFAYTQSGGNKIDTFVDFPISDLDLAAYTASKSVQLSSCYRLYAIINHYGSMEWGHYTASIYHEEQKGWFKFDDGCVTPMTKASIKTSAAYVLFYRRE